MIGAHTKMGRYLELRAAGTLTQKQILLKIQLEYLREANFVQYVNLRAAIPVFDLIEIEGEQMMSDLTKGRGGFAIEELTIFRPEEAGRPSL